MFGKKKDKAPIEPQPPRDALPQEKKKINLSKGFEYSIEIYDVWDTTSKRIPSFGANRIIKDNRSFLFNELKQFEEPFPENTEEYREYEVEQLDEKIKIIENKLREIEKGKNVHASASDLKRELRIYRGYKRSIQLRGNGSFMILNAEGVPTFQFDRIGNIKLPLYKNVDRSTIYIPSELKTKNITKILRDNDEKNGQEQIIKLSTYALLLLLVLLVCIMGFMAYKMMGLPVDVADLLVRVADNMQTISQSLNTLESEIIVNESNTVNPGRTNIE